MALVLGDIHGRLKKAEAFLNYKPEEEHIFVGDYCDSFSLPDIDIINTLKLVIESKAKLLLGNHDVHYLTDAPFKCTGYRSGIASGINEIIESFFERFIPVALADEFVITHGGISIGLGIELINNTNPESVVKRIEVEWAGWVHNRKQMIHNRSSHPSAIFNIGRARGGSHKFSGIFWADYRDEEYYGIPQVFGHSKTDLHDIIQISPGHWAIGCDNNRLICFNTKTKEVEDFSL
jgi:predicted phosphodiesterase